MWSHLEQPGSFGVLIVPDSFGQKYVEGKHCKSAMTKTKTKTKTGKISYKISP